MPEAFEGERFLGGAVFNDIDFWEAPGVESEARHKFSLNTCNGCHGAETGSAFLQIFPRFAGEQSQLAGFQTGITVSDPITGEPVAWPSSRAGGRCSSRSSARTNRSE